MTITALFRDYLIRRGLKQKYERSFRDNKIEDCPVEVDWGGDLVQQMELRRANSVGDPNMKVKPEMFMGADCAYSLFTWDKTPEGLNFWLIESDKWINYLMELVKDGKVNIN